MPKHPLVVKHAAQRERILLPVHRHPKRGQKPPDSSPARTRHLLALIVVVLFAFSLVAALFEARATALSSTLTQVVMLIIGYYFGKK